MQLNNSGGYSTKSARDQKLFKGLLIVMIAIFVIDSGIAYFDGKTLWYANALNYLFATLYYCTGPFVPAIWLLYGDCKIGYDNYNIKKPVLVFIPAFINVLLVLVSLKGSWIFYVDQYNVFHRGPIWYFSPLLGFTYFIIAFILIKSKRKQKSFSGRNISYYYLFLLIPPIACSVIQVLSYGASAIWIGYLISIFIIFINVQNNRIYTDNLTTVYNREYMEEQLESLYQNNRDKLFVLMLDVDRFKIINDTYGHIAGDKALICATDILKKACKKDYNISRFGGDEFVIFGQYNNSEEITDLILNIRQSLISFNKTKYLDFDISFSIGRAEAVGNEKPYSILKRADDDMFKEKLIKKKAMSD